MEDGHMRTCTYLRWNLYVITQLMPKFIIKYLL